MNSIEGVYDDKTLRLKHPVDEYVKENSTGDHCDYEKYCFVDFETFQPISLQYNCKLMRNSSLRQNFKILCSEDKLSIQDFSDNTELFSYSL